MFRIEYFTNLHTIFYSEIIEREKKRTHTARERKSVYFAHHSVRSHVQILFYSFFLLCFWMWVRKLHLSLIFQTHRMTLSLYLYIPFGLFCISCVTLAWKLIFSLFNVFSGELLIIFMNLVVFVCILLAIWDGPYHSLTLKNKTTKRTKHSPFCMLSSSLSLGFGFSNLLILSIQNAMKYYRNDKPNEHAIQRNKLNKSHTQNKTWKWCWWWTKKNQITTNKHLSRQ